MWKSKFIILPILIALLGVYVSISGAQEKKPVKKQDKKPVVEEQVKSTGSEKDEQKQKSDEGSGATIVSFRRDVFPVIRKHCLPCHAEEQMNPSDLFLDNYESLMAGGEHGKAIVPGKAEESLLIQKLGEKPPFGDRMPLKAKQPLSEKEIAVLKAWINQGAKKN